MLRSPIIHLQLQRTYSELEMYNNDLWKEIPYRTEMCRGALFTDEDKCGQARNGP